MRSSWFGIVHVFRYASDQIGGLAGDRDHRRPPDCHGVRARKLPRDGRRRAAACPTMITIRPRYVQRGAVPSAGPVRFFSWLPLRGACSRSNPVGVAKCPTAGTRPPQRDCPVAMLLARTAERPRPAEPRRHARQVLVSGGSGSAINLRNGDARLGRVSLPCSVPSKNFQRGLLGQVEFRCARFRRRRYRRTGCLLVSTVKGVPNCAGTLDAGWCTQRGHPR